MKIVALLVLGIFFNVSPFNLEDPQQAGVEYVEQNSQVQVIVDENNAAGKTTIVRIIDVQREPQVVLLSPNANRLEAGIERGSDQYILEINQLDYESLVKQNIGTTFDLGIKDSETQKNITVIIRNVDDENPTLIPPASECYMQEEIAINVTNSDCIFKVSDPDGWLNKMSFTIVTDSNERIFELVYKTPPAENVHESDVYLVLKDGITLDYENRVGYKLTTEAKDSAGNPTIPNPTVISYVTTVDAPPVWTYFPSIKHIDEETETSFVVSAIDPDKNAPKNVSFWFSTSSQYIDINRDTGNITVDKIDRELGITNILMVLQAFYSGEANTVVTESEMIFLVDDIDDNVAKIDRNVNTDIKVPENSGEVVLVNIPIEDVDEGENSVYDIDIKATPSITSVVNVFPKQGAGRTTVQLTINTTELNSKDPFLSDFEIELWTKGVKNPDNQDTLPITVHLVKQGSSNGVRDGVRWVTAIILTSATVLRRIPL